VKLDPWQRRMELGPGADPTQSQFEELGYSMLDTSLSIEGVFYIVHLYSIRGLTAPNEALVSSLQSEGKSRIAFGIGEDYNELAERITGFCLTEDEERWKEHKVNTQTFLLIQIGPSSRHKAMCGFYKRADGQIIYERKMFEPAHREIKTKAEKLTHKILGAISCSISHSQELYFNHLNTSCFGKAESGEALVQAPEFCGLLESALGMKSEELQNRLDAAASFADSISSRSADLLSLGITERDTVKRFLFFFLSIEAEINRIFKCIPSSAFAEVFRAPLDAPTSELVCKIVTGRSNNDLLVKFLWCMQTVWPQLCFDDLLVFKDIQKIRNDIAHGTFQKLPDQVDAAKAYRLAANIITMKTS
jgi:hypothetical protein